MSIACQCAILSDDIKAAADPALVLSCTLQPDYTEIGPNHDARRLQDLTKPTAPLFRACASLGERDPPT